MSVSPQGRISQLEEDLGEERSSSDRMMERLDKTKSQAGFLSLIPLSFIFLFDFGLVRVDEFPQLF